MKQSVESLCKDILQPVKDVEQYFQIEISTVLKDYLEKLVEGRVSRNFNSAALVIQGSASLFGKKVEYLHSLVLHLHRCITERNNAAAQQSKKETKEREKKEEKSNELFFSIEIRTGKNLSCLKKKATVKLSLPRKPTGTTKKKTYYVPMHLFPFDNEERGDPFYDTRGDIVGNKGDFALDLCRLTESAWLLLPTVDPSLISEEDSVSLSHCDADEVMAEGVNSVPQSSEVHSNNCDDIPATPDDEGFGSCPTNSQGIPSSAGTGSQQTPSQEDLCSFPPSTDEGIGSAPMEDDCHSPVSVGIENVPALDIGDADLAPVPIRRSMRKALTPCQLAQEEDPLSNEPIDPAALKPRKIEKKNTCILPKSLRNPSKKSVLPHVSQFCARTFFALDGRITSNSLYSYDAKGFDQNTRLLKRLEARRKMLMAMSRKNKTAIDPLEDDDRETEEVDVCRSDSSSVGASNLCVPFDDGDVCLQDPIVAEPNADDADIPIPEVPLGNIHEISAEQIKQHERTLMKYIEDPAMTHRVIAWESRIKPFLDEQAQLENFDINNYGSRILNSFENNNRKQTMTFRQMCKNKEKWEIHRYFMALLPLANIGNVDIETETRQDGTEEILVTLLSRKMHHKELEEFGHNDGSHD